MNYFQKLNPNSARTKVARSFGSGGMKWEVMRILRENPAGLTPEEAAAKLGCKVVTARSTINKLNAVGRVRDSGLRRNNANGNPVIVWTI